MRSLTLIEWFVVALLSIASYFILAMLDKPWWILAPSFIVMTVATWKVMLWREPDGGK